MAGRVAVRTNVIYRCFAKEESCWFSANNISADKSLVLAENKARGYIYKWKNSLFLIINTGVNDMMQDTELGRLEGFVSKLLDRFNALQADKKRVDDLLLQREERIAALQDELASLKDERGEVSSRVSGLLERIQEWEAGAMENDINDSMVGSNVEGGIQGSLF
jgi:hypothetical protein